MITYDAKRPWDFVRWRGSVAPAAVCWALPCAVIAVVYHHVIHSLALAPYLDEPGASETNAWSMFTSILGFLIVFRAQLAYARYWEGITLVEQACGVWLNGCSNLIAFCSTAPELQEQVDEFQYLLSRLLSLAVSFSMSEISKLDRARFPHLELDYMDPASMKYLEDTSAKQYVALQWIQRLVVENARTGVIDIQPPILSRVFQEFSIGIVHFIDANKISIVHFPFPFAQVVWIMLVFFSLGPVPMVCAVGMNVYKAAAYTFLIVFVFWSVHYIAVEIELPFGEDANDLPLETVNGRFNKILLRLTEMKAQQTPCLLGKPVVSVRSLPRQSSLVFDMEMDSAKSSPCGPQLLPAMLRHASNRFGALASRERGDRSARTEADGAGGSEDSVGSGERHHGEGPRSSPPEVRKGSWRTHRGAQGSAQDEWDGPEDEELPEELGAQRCSPTEEVRFPAPPARARTPEARPPDRLALPSALRFSPPPGRRSARPPDMRFP